MSTHKTQCWWFLNLNFFDRFPTVPNFLRYVLPDEVAEPLGQAQRRRSQSTTCLQKSLHRFLWIPFFIFVLEPLVLRLFLFYASVIFFKNYHLSTSLMKTNKFHYTFPLLLCFLCFEFWLFLFSFQLPNKKEAEGSIFIYNLPSNSMVRQKLTFAQHLCICPFAICAGSAQPSHFICCWTDQGEENHPQACLPSSAQLFGIWRSEFKKCTKRFFFTFSLACLDINNIVVSDRLGMPPMYMVVDIRWDDYAPEDEIVQMQDPTKDIFQNNNAHPISPSRKRWALLRKSKLSIPIDRLYQNHNLLKTHQRFYLDDQVANFILKLQILFHISLFNIPIFIFSHFVSHIQILCWRTDVRSNVEQLAVLKLLITKLTKANRANQVVTKITKPNPKYKSIPAAISTAENHGRHVITENHEGGSFLLLWDLNNLIFVLEQKSGYSSQATSTSSLWRLPLEWSPVRFSNEDNSGSSRWEPTPSKSAQSISTVSNTFNGRRSAFLLADQSWSRDAKLGIIRSLKLLILPTTHLAQCTFVLK